MDAYILLHGKHSGPDWGEDCKLFELSNQLRETALVDFQTYPWGVYKVEDEFYHKIFESSVAQIDSAIVNLKAQGATRIFLLGHSMGSNAILNYLQQRENSVDGAILISPAHNVHLPMFSKIHKWSVDHAKELIDAGRGNNYSHFADYDSEGTVVVVKCPALNYFSMLNPTGPANMKTNVEKLNWPANILVISGEKDITQKLFFESIYLNLKTKSSKNKYLLVPGDHSSVCWDSLDRITSWVSTL